MKNQNGFNNVGSLFLHTREGSRPYLSGTLNINGTQVQLIGSLFEGNKKDGSGKVKYFLMNLSEPKTVAKPTTTKVKATKNTLLEDVIGGDF